MTDDHGRASETVALLKRLVGIPSLSGDEAAVARAVCDRARSKSLSVETVEGNAVVRIGRAGGRRILLNSHLDTVAPADGWQTDPFTAVHEGDRITGLGANDAKGSVAAMLSAVERCGGADLKGEVVLALTVEEEVGSIGSGLERILERLGDFDAAVIGEPTDLAICRAQKGLLVLDVETSGTARHAAHAHRLEGGNAVIEAAKAIAALHAWTPGGEHPLLGPATCQITSISGGTRRNVVPDSCVFCLDVRTVDGDSTERIVDEVRSITGAKVTVVSDRMKPFETDRNAEIVRAAMRVLPDAPIIGSATMSDAVWTQRFPTIKIGPGRTERSHTAGEHIEVGELVAGADFYERLILEFMS